MNKAPVSWLNPRNVVIAGALLAVVLGAINLPQKFLSFNMNSLDSAAAAEGVQITKKAFVLIYDPVMPDGKKLSVSRNWFNPNTLTSQTVAFFQQNTAGKINYVVAETKEIDGFPKKQDGFTYTPQSYQSMINGTTPPHEPDGVDYAAILNDTGLDLCGKLNRNEIDEVWLFGAPYFGYNESALATSPQGPKGYAYNGPIIDQTTCGRLMPVMGFNYERGLAEMVHDWGHRIEATMSQVNGDWEENRTSHNWDRFALVDEQSPDFAFSGCGSTHWPPNATSDYDYGNTRTASTFCDDFYNYPNLSPMSSVLKNVSCTEWGCTQEGYLAWWFKHIPHFSGTAADGHLNDWWEYIMDPNKAVINETPGVFSNLSSQLSTNSATFNFAYSGSTGRYIIDMSTVPDMSGDVYLSFKEGRNLPLVVENAQNVWDKYTCSRNMYWRVYSSDRSIMSPIQSAVIDCTVTPSPSPTATPSPSPTPSPTPTLTPSIQPSVTPKPTKTPSPTPIAMYTFTPSADAYTSQKNQSTNYGKVANLFVHKTSEGPGEQRSYLKFKVEKVTKFVQAKLRIYLTDGSYNAPVLYKTSTSWDEKTIKWNNQPGLSSQLANPGFASANAWMEYDVTSTVKSNTTFSFALAGESKVTDGIIASSREGNNPAQLVIRTR